MSRHLKFQFVLNLDSIHRCFRTDTKLLVRPHLNFKQGNFSVWSQTPEKFYITSTFSEDDKDTKILTYPLQFICH